jgi:hypothetical protein
MKGRSSKAAGKTSSKCRFAFFVTLFWFQAFIVRLCLSGQVLSPFLKSMSTIEALGELLMSKRTAAVNIAEQQHPVT